MNVAMSRAKSAARTCLRRRLITWRPAIAGWSIISDDWSTAFAGKPRSYRFNVNRKVAYDTKPVGARLAREWPLLGLKHCHHCAQWKTRPTSGSPASAQGC
ncbi:hypothetical protein EYC95_01855 [Pseudomonas sp. BGI-2]|nr:hypothetical protein EYC95_01855 [Pseudomonas sp. BGI-2]